MEVRRVPPPHQQGRKEGAKGLCGQVMPGGPQTFNVINAYTIPEEELPTVPTAAGAPVTSYLVPLIILAAITAGPAAELGADACHAVPWAHRRHLRGSAQRGGQRKVGKPSSDHLAKGGRSPPQIISPSRELGLIIIY